MATFGQIRTAVSKRLLDPNGVAVSVSNVDEAINDAISYWKFRRFWFNEGYSTTILTPQDGTFALPNDFLVPATKDDGLNIEYSNNRYPLAKISQPQYDSVWLSNGYGIPRAYARVGDSYEVYPLPDQAYTVNAHYLKEYPFLVNEDDTNDFTIYAYMLIRYWSLANLSAELRQDDRMETYYREAADNEYRNLQVMTNKSNATGRLTLNSTLL